MALIGSRLSHREILMGPNLESQHTSSWPYDVRMRCVWGVCVCVVGMEGRSDNQKHHVL